MLQSKKQKIFYFVISSVLTAVVTFFAFVLLGSFYSSNEHSIGLSIIVWASFIFASYLIVYGLLTLIYFIFKRIKVPFLNGYALFSGVLIILLVDLFDPNPNQEYLFIKTIAELIPGVIAMAALLFKLNHKSKN